MKRNALVRFWRDIIKKAKEKLVDKDKLENRKQYVEEEIDRTLVEIEQKLIKARVRFKELIKKGQRLEKKSYLSTIILNYQIL